MARPIWKGYITFGLVNVPVTLYSGETRKDLQLRMIDSRNRARVRYERVNDATGEEVPWDRIVRGYEYDGGDYVLIGDEELSRAAPEMTKTIEIEEFVERESVSPLFYDKPYYLVPSKNGEKGYVLLRETLARKNRMAVARVVIRTRRYVAAMLPVGRALILDLMRYQQELRQPDEFDLPEEDMQKYRVSARELEMAEQLVESMTAEWEPEKYHDEFREAIGRYIQEKIESGETAQLAGPSEAEEEPAPTINMMDLLKRSLEQAPGGRGRKAGQTKGAHRSRPQQAG